MAITAQDLADEIKRLTLAGEVLTFQVHPISAFQIVALLQLALRHPGIGNFNRTGGAELVEDFRSWFAAIGATTVVEAIDAGNDPAKDDVITPTSADVTCEHGTAMDVHCCNCHSGFIFDRNHECPPADAAPLIIVP